MKNHTIFFKKHNLILLILFFIGLINGQLFAEIPNPMGAKQYAEIFFKANAPKFASGESFKAPVLEQRYQSPANKKTQLFVFQNSTEGFVIVAQNQDNFALLGYSHQGKFDSENIPPQLQALLQLYEDSVQILSSQKMLSGTPAMTPLFDEAGISLNQFVHEELGDCYSGCIATAFAQIMAFYKFPSKGRGSHCYTDPKNGQLCVDFENTTYNWNNPTYDDYKKLSYHIGVAVNMHYCSYLNRGSAPVDYGYENAIRDYFGYYVSNVLKETFYIKNEVSNRRPVYIELPGDPVGHALVVDGYDTDGLFHLNFGWGGLSNGYYALNTSSRLDVSSDLRNNVISAFCISPTILETNQQDSLALAAVSKSLNGTGWDLTQPAFTWKGVVTMNGRVIRLKLNNTVYSTYKGTIAPEIGNLSELTELDLFGQFNGELPASIANLTNLQKLSISAGVGTFKVVLPENIGNLIKLEYFAIPWIIEGKLPSTFVNLKALKEVDFGGGRLIGEIPAEIGNLTNLEKLILSRNKLSGNLPNSICNLVNLTELHLSENQLTGSIPSNIGNLTKLTTLNLDNNRLTGTIPLSIGSLTSLTSLKLNNNQLTGTIPAEIGNCTNIKNIGLFVNQLEGNVPPEIGKLIAVEILDLSNNKLTSIPNEIGRLTNLKELYLYSNSLTSLPDSLSKLSMLKKISVSHNKLESLPENFGNWESLTSLGLRNNKLCIFPNQVCLAPNLQVLDLGNNSIEKLPVSVSLLSSKIEYFAIDSNLVSGRIPSVLLDNPKLMTKLRYNRFTFEDIPEPNPKLYTGVDNQRPVSLSKKVFNVGMGDTVKIDIRTIAPFSLPENVYDWFSVERNRNVSENFTPILEVVINETTINNRYFCKVTNPASPEYYFINGSYEIPLPCLTYLTTDTISFRLASEEELISEKYGGSYVVSSKNLPQKIVEDRIVKLVPPLKVRGIIKWQASADGNTWHDLSVDMTENDLKANFISVQQNELVLSPKTPAFYRCNVQDVNCESIYSDTIKVNPFGKTLYDETINVTTKSLIIKVDSIEVTLPKGIYDKDFRLTITKLDNPPTPPEGVKVMTTYDVTVSFAETFDIPLVIKLKTIDKKTFDSKNIHNYKALYFDEKTREWVNFENSYVSLVDTTMVFETNHLTVISVGWGDWLSGYDKGYERNNIRVFYIGKHEPFMDAVYGKQQTAQPWHVAGVPKLVQDITEYLSEVRTKFQSEGFPVSETFTVYIKNMDDADGVVGVSGMINDYLTINTLTENPIALRKLCAHEYMHYTQGKYISPDPGNIFWMEANGHLTDRLVWNEAVIPVSESETYLLDGRKGTNSIFNFLSTSWDYWDSGFWTQNIFGNVNYCYLAGTFLHYMRSYSEAESKLDIVKLLKETTRWSGDSWRQYLSNYITFSMNSLIGDEYDSYVKYILSGENPNFTILNTTENPFSGLINQTGAENDGVFVRRINYKFGNSDQEAKKDEIELTVPYLASKVYLLYNSTPDRATFVSFKRKDDASGYQNKIYFGKYNFNLKKVEYIDISDSTNYNFMLEARTQKSAEESQNMCFLLFVNKNNPIGSEKNFDVSFELNALPIPDFENLLTGYIAGSGGSDLGVHMNDKGEVTNFVFYTYHDKPDADKDITSSRTILNDSSYVVNITYTYTTSFDFEENHHTNENKGTLTIYYNFYEAKINLYSHETYTTKVSTPTKDNILNLVSVSDKELEVINFMNYQIEDGRTLFTTNNSTETQAVVKHRSQKVKSTYYDWDTGDPMTVITRELVSTNYERGDIILVLKFENRK